MFSALSKAKIIILATFNLSSANAFNLVKAKILLFVKGLTFTKQQKFRLYQIEAFADDSLNGKVEHIVGKGENARYQHFLSRPCIKTCHAKGR